MLVASPLDLQQNELRQARVHNVATPGPPTPVKGQLWFNSTANELFYYDGTIWQSAKSGAGSSGPPSGPAGGNLSGTYPNPTIGSLQIVDSMVAAANKDGTAVTPSLRTLGPGAQQAAAGNDSRLTDARAPSGAAGGDLTGSFPNPTIGTGKVTTAHILDGTITDTDVAAANKDGANATPGMRTLGASAGKAMPGTWSLDVIASATPVAGSISMSGQPITNLGTPTATTDAATKGYADGVAQGLDAKQSVRFASTANLGLSGTASLPDGLAVNVGDRVLAKDQGTPSLNGIYVVASGTWTRATDADAWAELPSAFVFVEEGNTQKDTGWVCTVDAGGTLGTTAVTWTQFSGAGQITDGIGLLKTGNTLDVRLDGSTIEAPADILQVKDGGITNAKLGGAAITIAKGGTGATNDSTARQNLNAAGTYTTTTHGAGTTITIPYATHLLGGALSQFPALIVQCRLVSTGEEIFVDNTVGATGTVTITFAQSQAANSVRVTLLG